MDRSQADNEKSGSLVDKVFRTEMEPAKIGTDATSRKIENVDAKGKAFIGVNFSYSMFVDCYFRDATFEKCQFVGCKFLRCNFRGARFDRCDFKYAFFDQTIIEIDAVTDNLPDWPNVAKELLQNHRANAKSICDYRAEKRYIKEELEAEREHWRRAWSGKEQYYKRKYKGARKKAHVLLKRIGLFIDDLFWGHGESIWKALRSVLFLSLIASVVLVFVNIEWSDGVTLGQIWKVAMTSFLFVLYTLVDSPHSVHLDNSEFIAFALSAIRWLVLGLIVAALYRRLAHW